MIATVTVSLFLIVCALIVGGCICRVGVMTASKHKLGWALMYIAAAAFAMGEAIDTLAAGLPTEWEMAGLLALALNLLLTHRHWKQGPPPITCKEPAP